MVKYWGALALLLSCAAPVTAAADTAAPYPDRAPLARYLAPNPRDEIALARSAAPPRTAPAAWGANVEGSPVLGDSSALEPVTIFVVPVSHWSDRTSDR